MTGPQKEDSPEVTQDVALCHNCLAENHPEAHFCSRCNSPLTPFASTDPVASIWSRGDGWRKGVTHPAKRITLIGMWLLFGFPSVCLLLIVFVVLLTEGISDGVFILLGLFAAYSAIPAVILFKTTRNYYHLKAQQNAEPPDGQDSDFA